jgi:hypothetical protein
MESLYWYISLSAIGVVTASYTIYKKKNEYKASTLIVFFLFTACLTWIGEFIVLGLLDAYAYKTGMFEDIWAQNLFGHLLINTTLYPAAGIVMVAYSLRYGWIFFVAALFTLIEYLFVNLRIYEQHWWRYYMTFLAVMFFMLIFRKWFSKISEKPYGITRSVTFYFIAMLIAHIPAPILLLLGKQYYQLNLVNNLFGNLYLSSIIIIFFYHLIEAFILVIFTCKLKQWYWSIVPIVTSIVVQSIFVRMNILIIGETWSLFYTLVLYEIFIVIYILVEKTTLKPKWYHGI